MTNVDSAADYLEPQEGLVRAFYPDDHATRQISVRQAAADYKSWRLAHYRMKITSNRYGN
jgi:hypothetical protein